MEIEEKPTLVHNEAEESAITPEMRQRISERYGIPSGGVGNLSSTGQTVARDDVEYMLQKIHEMEDQDAIQILVKTIEVHSDDPNFPSDTMAKIKVILEGEKTFNLAYPEEDYSFELRSEAAIIHYHSPYPEVRAVSDPHDDPDIPVETPRAYFLGIMWMAAATVINTFFSPRQPAITIGSNVLQLLLAPCGVFLAKTLPDWTLTIFGKKIRLNPGPWTYKEQMLATIIFNVASGPGGTYYVYLVQKLPQYLNHSWVSFGYEIVLAISIQFFGFGFAGALRRFVIYPAKSLWPKCFPTLALNRALLVPDKKETIHGWRLSRYKFFFISFGLMFLYFWIPNFLFQALRSFNWMTWIAPQNFNLGMVTGFYGGMGFNPWATFDWNVSGSGSLVTPFFSTLQQYIARVLSGLIIIGMYWGNYVWSAYTPINSNESFANNGELYNVSKVMGDNGLLDINKYEEYGPPFFSGANVFGQGAWFAWYPMVLIYVVINQWTVIKGAAVSMYRGLRYKEHFSNHDTDPHTRMMANYKEVPDWWFLIVLALSLVFGIIALKVYPVHTPVWSLFAVIGISAVLIIPAALLLSVANVSLGFNVLFQLLGGLWFAGNPEASIIVTAYGSNFDSQTENYLSDQKLGHYAKLPPRALFRGQMTAVLINCFIFIGFLNWMVSNFQKDSLCTWDNPEHFVCTDAVLVFASAVEFGAFGVRNMFTLYPILPWCFLMGAVVGLVFALAHKYGSTIRSHCRRTMSEARFEFFDKHAFNYLAKLKTFNPAVFWAGALNWTGGNNLSYATNALYLSFIFMYYIKRRYTAWFQKYNYLLESGFDVGVAISGIIQTFAFNFGSKDISINWWGNTVSQAGVDFQSYNQNATLLPIPAKGYFGPDKKDWPRHF
ncbi:oligopeptide transporter 2 [Trichomonascus vanleenenianus]|uniref:oligopeptide transporter 2 n=1 Tax=Trichomonascus vanleenenianus TaxID=2268995 RepID=UPI003EC9B168